VAKLDDNDRAKRGDLGGYLDGTAAIEVPEPSPPPASGPVPRLLGAEKATEAIRAALRSPAPLVVLRSTTGAGKSAEVRQLLAEQASAEDPAAMFVPTHRLGEQTQQGLWSLGVSASRPLGVARVHLPVVREGEDPHACIHHEAAELLAQAGGHVREELCSGCSYRKVHPKTGAECPAYASGASRAPVVVLQQPLLADTLATAAEELAQQEPEHPPLKTIIVDELPPVVSRVPWTAAEAYRKHRLDTETNPEAMEGLGPLLDAIAKRIRSTVEGGVSLRQILATSGLVGADIERTLEDARAVDPRALWQRSLPVRLALRAMNPTSRDHALARLATVAAATGLLRALIEAAHEPDRPLLWREETGPSLATLAPWVRQVRPFLAAGGKLRLLDATAPVDALRALWPELELHAIEVRDAERIQRRYLVWQHGARGRHTAPNRTLLPDELRGPLRRLAAVITETGARSVGLLAHKPLADAMRGWLLDLEVNPSSPPPAWCPEELAAIVTAGVELRPGHYGAQRGLDTWADVDVLATVGDPWANLGASIIEAAVLGIEAEGWTQETARAELVQAWGRARPVHRPSPCVIVHLGAPALAPSADWAPQWAGVKQEWPQRGRPPTVLPLSDPATWAEERARLGLSRKAHAEALGLSWTTYRRKEPKRTIEGGVGRETENDQETPTKEGGHNPQEAVSSGVAGNPAALSSLIPDYGPPDSCGFVASPPSMAPPSAPAPSGVRIAPLDGPPELASARRSTPGGLVARALGGHGWVLVA
jgi:hypothetical protein